MNAKTRCYGVTFKMGSCVERILVPSQTVQEAATQAMAAFKIMYPDNVSGRIQKVEDLEYVFAPDILNKETTDNG